MNYAINYIQILRVRDFYLSTTFRDSLLFVGLLRTSALSDVTLERSYQVELHPIHSHFASKRIG